MSRRPDPLEQLLREHVGELRAPGEAEATERAVSLAAETARESQRGTVIGGARRRTTAVAAAALAAAAILTLTPAGAEVRHWIDRAVSEAPPAVKPSAPSLDPLPAGGRLLVEAGDEVWIVERDGSRRSLGEWDEAAFSPGGINVTVADGGQLAAVTAEGEPVWEIGSRRDRPRVEDPRWAPSGIRIAYRRGGELRVAIADGSGSATLARGVLAVPPAWQPRSSGVDPDVVAFAKPGRVILIDGDTGVRRGQIRDVRATGLEWVNREQLLVVERGRVGVHRVSLDGRATRIEVEVPLPPGVSVRSATASPDGNRVAVVAGSAPGSVSETSRLLVARIEPDKLRVRTLFSGPGAFETPVFSPDGGWIQFGWPDSDQWVFIRPEEEQKLLKQVEIVSTPGAAFSVPGRDFPSVSDWCCG